MRLAATRGLFLGLLFTIAFLTGSSDARTWTVSVRGEEPDGPFRFVPDTLRIAYGDTVRWEWMSGSHTTTEFDGNPCTGGAGLWNALVDALHPTFSVVFDQSVLPPGDATILYECSNHCFLGMDGVILLQATGVPFSPTLDGPPPGPRVTECTWGNLKAKVIREGPR